MKTNTGFLLSLLGLMSIYGPLTLASQANTLSNEKTKIPESQDSVDCARSGIKPWSFDTDKPIESPCKLTRTAPPIELGPKLLGLGKIEKGVRLPTGAIWQPALYLLGGLRSAISTQDTQGQDKVSEWSNRADVFFNLQLSATERVVLGFTPLSKGRSFSRYQFSPDRGDGWDDQTNTDIDTFWFEGDLGELFPRLRNGQRKSLDMGFSIGRQVIAFQDSVMMNDALDALVLVKNNLHLLPHAPSTRLSMVYAWNNINRADRSEDNSARFFGLFTETDTWKRTIELDLAFMTSDQEADGGFFGIASTQRIGHWNTTVRINSSFTSQQETRNMRNGSLLTAQLSRNLKASHNVYYFNLFAGFDEYRVATRDTDVGGPLGLIGISFASPGLGTFTPAISERLDNSYGFATGFQWFMNHERSNLMLEIAYKQQDNSFLKDQQAISLRYQKALGRRWLWQVDTYAANGQTNETNYGLRTELGLQF